MVGMVFRFVVTAPEITDVRSWQDELRRIEGAGFDTVGVADHFTEGWAMEPMVTLTAAAMATTTLRLQTSVLGNDYRHPVLVHRMAATLDVLSGGRFLFGVGAGWNREEMRNHGTDPRRRFSIMRERARSPRHSATSTRCSLTTTRARSETSGR